MSLRCCRLSWAVLLQTWWISMFIQLYSTKEHESVIHQVPLTWIGDPPNSLSFMHLETGLIQPHRSFNAIAFEKRYGRSDLVLAGDIQNLEKYGSKSGLVSGGDRSITWLKSTTAMVPQPFLWTVELDPRVATWDVLRWQKACQTQNTLVCTYKHHEGSKGQITDAQGDLMGCI